MKAAIFSPYLDTLGGGERYTISFAKCLQEMGWDVYIESSDKLILTKIQKRLGINTTKLKVVPSINRGNGYDLCFWLSDGSIPTLYARKNILHFQRPFYGTDGKSLINRMKFFRINKVLVNSNFTKKWIDNEYPQKSFVLYPPVDVRSFKSGKKVNTILSVGRFSLLEQSKRQDVLIDVFKTLFDERNSVLRKEKWQLIVAGGSDVGRTHYVDDLIQKSKHYPITILENPPFVKIQSLFSQAKIYWTAAGYDVDENTKPEKVEHFGITVVEAMAAGCVPMALDAGGHREILNDSNGILWSTKDGLKKQTQEIIDNPRQLNALKKKAVNDAIMYSYEEFCKHIKEIL
ncbi:glycosyltransferase family 4 protein [Candidatus Woesebacteria bacterium]|nr:MAG: glycosyltransferase family 4 protein [Candidatus Woesebacteria bacterium]